MIFAPRAWNVAIATAFSLGNYGSRTWVAADRLALLPFVGMRGLPPVMRTRREVGY